MAAKPKQRKSEGSGAVRLTKKGATDKSDSLAQRVENKLRKLVLTLDPTANTISSVSVVYTQVYGFKRRPKFLDDWTKYGPPFISSTAMKLVEGEIGIDKLNKKIAERLTARSNKDWGMSDSIRDELKLKGIVLKDGKDGTSTWEVA